MKTMIVSKKFNNKNVLTFLQDTFPSLDINTIFKYLRKKDILVNNVRISKNISLSENDNVTIYIPDRLLYNTETIPVIYEDNNILVVNKPTEMEVTQVENSLEEILKKQLNMEVYATHRLDRNTSGLIIFAKNKLTHDILLEKFKNRRNKKTLHYFGLWDSKK
jgi:23S rRNA pseudouridine955/2504/2580 synthase